MGRGECRVRAGFKSVVRTVPAAGREVLAVLEVGPADRVVVEVDLMAEGADKAAPAESVLDREVDDENL